MQDQDRRERIRAGLRARRSSLDADNARFSNPQGVDLTGPSTAFADTDEEPKGWGRMFLDALNPFSDFNASIRRGAVRGAIGAVDELGDVAASLGGVIAKGSGLGEKFGGQAFLDWWAQDDDDRNPLHIGKDIIEPGPNTIIGGLTEGAVQLGIGMLGVGKFVKLRGAGAIKKGLIQGAIADAIFFDANEARMSNMVADGPEWFGRPLFEFLAAKEDDGEAEGRFKNALEGLLLGGTIGTVLHFAKVARLSWKGRKVDATILASDYKVPVEREVIELPSGRARLSHGADDTAPFLRDAGEPTVSLAEGGEVGRRFEFDGANGPGALDVRMEKRVMPDGAIVEDVLVVDAIGKVDPKGAIIVNPESGFDAGRRAMQKIGAELAAEFPQAKVVKGLRLKSGLIEELPLDRFKQEVFPSRGEAATEALSMADGRTANASPLDRLGRKDFGDIDKIVDAYKTNRSTRTIAKMEKQFVRNLRVNMGASKKGLIGLIDDIAKRLERAGGGSAKVMRGLADKSLEVVGGKEMEGLLKAGDLSSRNEVAVRRAAGLVMQSLGDDVARYSIRYGQGGSNLAYLQLGRALDQMVHVETILTGKPAKWLNKYKSMAGDGRLSSDPKGRGSNTGAPDMGDGPIKTAADDAADAAIDQKFKDAAAAEKPRGDVSAEASALDDTFDPSVADALPEAGVAPGPESLRNLSKVEIQRLGRFVALADGNPRAILTSLKAARMEVVASARPGMKKMLMRWRLSAMLSGVSTQMVNVVSTGIQSALLPTELMIGGVFRRSSRDIKEAAGTMQGLVLELGDAWGAMRMAWKAGKGHLDPAFMTRELDAGRFTGFLSVANVPQDFLTSADEFFKVLNYRAKVRGKSLTSSLDAGLNPKDTAKRLVDDLEASITADGAALNVDALEYSRAATFTDELKGKAASASGLFRGEGAVGTAGEFFIPFIRTPHNIMKNIIVRSPLAAANMKGINASIAAGGSEASAAIGRLTTAAALTGTAGILVSQGRITGRGPLNPTTRDRWKDAGFEPYTISFGNVKVNYNRLSSIFGTLAMMADLHYAAGDMKPEQMLEGVTSVVASMLNYVSDQGFIGNAAEMMDVMIKGDAAAMQEFVEKTAIGMAVPKAISQFTGLDDTMRETDGMIDELYANIPGLSEELPPKLNIFREPVIKAPGSMDRIFNPFTQLGRTDNETAMALFRVGKNMALPPSKRFGGRVDLRDTKKWGEVDGMSPYDFWQTKVANPLPGLPSLKQELTTLVNGPEWQMMPEGSEDWPGGPRFEAVARIVNIRQEIAEQAMFSAFPGLMDEDINEKMLRAFGKFGGKPATDDLQSTLNPSGQR